MKINLKYVFIQKFISICIPLFFIFTFQSFLSEAVPSFFYINLKFVLISLVTLFFSTLSFSVVDVLNLKTLSKTSAGSTLVIDKPVWEVKPKGTYSDEIFYVGLGNKYLSSIVIPEDDRNNLDLYRDRGY